jgi:hypothetical protein
MNQVYRFSYALGILSILSGFTSEQSGGKENRKQPVNLSGTLTTQTGKTYQVENISIAGLIDGIRFFELPDSPAGSLNYDPHAGAVFTVKLEEGVVIKVAKPRKMWTYQRNERAAKIEYIAITFKPCDKEEKQEYIIEATRPILAQEIGACGNTTAVRIPFSQVESLVIEKSSPWTEFRACPARAAKKKAQNMTDSADESYDNTRTMPATRQVAESSRRK